MKPSARPGAASSKFVQLVLPGLPGLIGLIALLAAGCVAGGDLHLAPLFTRVHTADAGIEVEALGGLYRTRYAADDGRFEELTVGPLFGARNEENGDRLFHVLVPLGYTRSGENGGTSFFFPLYVWTRSADSEGNDQWQLVALPGFIVQKNEALGTQFGIFPFWGRFRDFITFNQLDFLLWPLYVYAERDGRISHHFLFPFLGWTRGAGEKSFRLFPLYSRTRIEGRYDRRFFLWPFFHYQRNFLGGGNEAPETRWMFWPFFGRSKRGTFRATTLLWPFFGYSHDPRDGFWALDFPWPLVRLQRGPGDVRRTRFWPFYSYLNAQGLESRSFLWPFFTIRHEDGPSSKRDSVYLIPFWRAWDRTDKETGETSSWRKLWPLVEAEREGPWRRGAFPSLNPLWRNQLVDRFFAWIWKAWEWEAEHELRRERAWLGLWRRERGLGEDRRSLSGLWAHRRYAKGGRQVRETSLLFGLVRWRVTEERGFDMLPMRFPGPGWPAFGEADMALAERTP